MCPNDARPLSRHAFLIVLDDSIVAQDLAETVSEHDPAAGLIPCRTLDEAIAALAHVERIAVAFVEAGPAEFAASPLAGLIAAKGGRVVLIGDDAEDSARMCGHAVLQRPFSTEMVLALLADPVPR